MVGERVDERGLRACRVVSCLVIALSLAVGTPTFADPVTFDIATQPQFGTFVSGSLTFDPVGVHFAGPFDISVGAIALPPPSSGLPATEFTDLNTEYVIQPNTSFHSLWVFHGPSVPFDHLFLFMSFDSCSSTGACTFEMTYYESNCSDCPPDSRVQGAIVGTPVPEPGSGVLAITALIIMAITYVGWRRRKGGVPGDRGNRGS